MIFLARMERCAPGAELVAIDVGVVRAHASRFDLSVSSTWTGSNPMLTWELHFSTRQSFTMSANTSGFHGLPWPVYLSLCGMMSERWIKSLIASARNMSLSGLASVSDSSSLLHGRLQPAPCLLSEVSSVWSTRWPECTHTWTLVACRSECLVHYPVYPSSQAQATRPSSPLWSTQ